MKTLLPLIPLLLLSACKTTQTDPRSSTLWAPMPIAPASQEAPVKPSKPTSTVSRTPRASSPAASGGTEASSPYDAKPAASPLRHDTPDKPLYSR